MASSTILAGVGTAFIQIILAVDTSEAVNAKTRVVADAIQTSTSVEARAVGTVVGVDGALTSFITKGAVTGVGAVRVATCGTILARRR